MNETCPGCGDDLRERIKLLLDAKPPQGLGVWARTAASRLSECLQQLAQRDERNAALEARIKELEAERVRERDQLRADLVTVVPVVRAAMWYANAEAQRNDAEAVMAMGQIYDCVRDLPAAVLERMGVPDA